MKGKSHSLQLTSSSPILSLDGEPHPITPLISSLDPSIRRVSPEPCEICGSVGIASLMMTCFKCRDTHEHTYCAKVFLQYVPHIRICEACRFSSRLLLIPDVADDQMDSETTLVDPKDSLNSRVDDHEADILRTNDMEDVFEDQMDSETTVVDGSSDPENSHSSIVHDHHETAKVRAIDMEEVVPTSLIHLPLQPHTSPLAKETSSLYTGSSHNNEQHDQPSQAFLKKRMTLLLMGKHISLSSLLWTNQSLTE